MVWKIRDCSNYLQLLCLLACVALLASGCSGSNNYVLDTQQFSTSVVAQLDEESKAIAQKKKEVDKKSKSVLTFKEACLLAARNDKRISAFLVELEKTNIDISGARSYLLPRFRLSVDADIPLTSSDDAKSDLTGGVYVDYNIWRAVAVKDETVLRKALAEKSLIQLKLAVNELERNFVRHLREIALLEYKFQKKQQTLILAKQAYRLAKVYANQQSLGATVLLDWKSKIDTAEFEKISLQKELENQKFALADLMGLSILQQVIISDKNSVLRQQNVAGEKTLSPSDVWRKQSEARLYELEMIAAEVAISLVELERLPQLNATLGVGSIPLQNSSLDPASTLMRLSVTMPLFDMGDYQRKYAKSCIHRNRVKREMKLNAIRLWNRVQLAGNVYEMTEKNLSRAEKTIVELKKQIDKKKILIAEAGGDGLSIFVDKSNLLRLEILRQQAKVALQGAADDWRFAAGDDVVSDSVDTIVEKLIETRYRAVD